MNFKLFQWTCGWFSLKQKGTNNFVRMCTQTYLTFHLKLIIPDIFYSLSEWLHISIYFILLHFAISFTMAWLIGSKFNFSSVVPNLNEKSYCLMIVWGVDGEKFLILCRSKHYIPYEHGQSCQLEANPSHDMTREQFTAGVTKIWPNCGSSDIVYFCFILSYFLYSILWMLNG